MENPDDLSSWLEDLDLQTLTDELKHEIFSHVIDIADAYYKQGWSDAKEEIIYLMENKMDK